MDIRKAIIHELSNKVLTLKTIAELNQECLDENFIMALENIDILVRYLLDTYIKDMNLEKKFTEIDLESVIDDVLEDLRLLLNMKKVKVDKRLTDCKPITANEFIFKRILYNLLHNAIKFSPKEGNVKINCIKQNGKIIISIENSVAEEREEKGSGLGLEITKDLVNIMGANLEFIKKKNTALSKLIIKI